MSLQLHDTTATWPLTLRVRLHVTLVTLVVSRSRAFFVVALVDLGVGVTKLDGNVSLELVLESNCLHT